MPYNKSELKMPPQTNITEKRIRMSIILFMHINVGAGLAPTSLALSLTPVSLPKNYVAFSEAFSPNSLAWQSPSAFSHQMGLPSLLSHSKKIMSHFRTDFPQNLSHGNHHPLFLA